jgi:hypothetical protein
MIDTACATTSCSSLPILAPLVDHRLGGLGPLARDRVQGGPVLLRLRAQPLATTPGANAQHVSCFGQSLGVGWSSVLAALPILALLFRRAAPVVVALAFLVSDAASVLLDLPDGSSESTVVTVVAGACSAGAYLRLGWGLATLGLWWVSVLVDFVTGRESVVLRTSCSQA